MTHQRTDNDTFKSSRACTWTMQLRETLYNPEWGFTISSSHQQQQHQQTLFHHHKRSLPIDVSAYNGYAGKRKFSLEILQRLIFMHIWRTRTTLIIQWCIERLYCCVYLPSVPDFGMLFSYITGGKVLIV